MRLLPALLLLTTPALAQTPDDEALKQRITTLYNQGNQASLANNWKAAHKAFLEAWNLKHHLQIAANLARAEFKLAMYRDAAEHLDYVMRNAPADTPAAEQKLVQDMFDEARSHIGEFIVEVNVEGAEIFVDGSSVGKAPLQTSVFVEPGTHIVEAKLHGYPNARQSADVKAGSAQMTIRLKLEKPSASGIVPPKDLNEESGKPNKAVMIAGWSAVGAGIIATGIAAGFAISHDREMTRLYKLAEASNRGEQNECNSPNYAECERKYYEAWESWSTTGNIAINMGIITGVVAAGVLTYAFWPRKSKEDSPPVQVGVHMGRDGGGAVFQAAW